MWALAVKAKPDFVSVTTYNEWGEGTQIEAAVKIPDDFGYGKSYHIYGDNVDERPFKYINSTQQHYLRFLLESFGNVEL